MLRPWVAQCTHDIYHWQNIHWVQWTMMTVQTIIVVHCVNSTTHHTVTTTVHETSSRPGARTTTTLVCMDSLWDITRFIAIISHQSSNNGNKLPLNWPYRHPLQRQHHKTLVITQNSWETQDFSKLILSWVKLGHKHDTELHQNTVQWHWLTQTDSHWHSSHCVHYNINMDTTQRKYQFLLRQEMYENIRSV